MFDDMAVEFLDFYLNWKSVREFYEFFSEKKDFKEPQTPRGFLKSFHFNPNKKQALISMLQQL